MKVWVVTGENGSYSDTSWWVEGVFMSDAAARAAADSATEASRLEAAKYNLANHDPDISRFTVEEFEVREAVPPARSPAGGPAPG